VCAIESVVQLVIAPSATVERSINKSLCISRQQRDVMGKLDSPFQYRPLWSICFFFFC